MADIKKWLIGLFVGSVVVVYLLTSGSSTQHICHTPNCPAPPPPPVCPACQCNCNSKSDPKQESTEDEDEEEEEEEEADTKVATKPDEAEEEESEETDRIPASQRVCFPKITGSRPDKQGQVHEATSFGQKLSEISGWNHVRRVLELGTWYGGGSTYQISTALRNSGGADNCKPNPHDSSEQCCARMAITLEIYEPAWTHARQFLQDLPVWCMLGTSVNESMMLKPDEIPDHEKTQHYDLYYERDLKLLSSNDPLLQELCEKYEFDFVLIDGNEYTGWGEYVIINQYCKPRYLAIHDASSLKTMKIEAELKKPHAPYKMIFSGRDAVAWLVYERVPV